MEIRTDREYRDALSEVAELMIYEPLTVAQEDRLLALAIAVCSYELTHWEQEHPEEVNHDLDTFLGHA